MTEHEEELRAHLARLDPMPPSVPVDPSTSPRAQELLERVMSLTDQNVDHPSPSPARWRRPALLAGAASLAAVLGIGAVLAGGDDAAPTPKAKTTLALTAPGSAGGAVTSTSCLMFSVDTLKDMEVAFGGTVTEVAGTQVTIDVDRWYKGGTADQVTLTTLDGNVALDGVEFVQGKRYLVTATDGTVNTCGYSGEATADYEASFEAAF